MSSFDANAWLAAYLKSHGGVAGTVHLREGQTLRMLAAVNLPPKVVEATQQIPFGKGMAGLAFERDKPVQTCNLQDDTSGDVRPGAKAVNASAAVAIPIHDAAGQIRAVVGIAFAGEREIQADELAVLSQAAEAFPAQA